MNIVVLTNQDSKFGLTILNELRARGVRVHAAVLLAQPLSYDLQLFKWVRKRVGLWQAIYFGVRRVLHGFAERREIRSRPGFETRFERLAERVVRTRGTNSSETIEALRTLSPDVVVIGQTGIIRKKLLGIPRFGVLNGHPGILPDYRGIDSATWALVGNAPDKIGFTVHWVDAGVDTGPIVRRRFVSPAEIGDVDVLAIDDKLFDIASTELADVVSQMDAENPPAGDQQSIDKGRQYYKMRLRDERKARRILRALLR